MVRAHLPVDPPPNPITRRRGGSAVPGRVERGLPEFVVLGRAPAASLAMAEWADGLGALVTTGRMRFGSRLVRVDPVPPEWLGRDPGRMGGWFAYYRSGRTDGPPPALAQLVWADQNDRFPDDPLCDRFVVTAQPLLSVDPINYPRP